MTLTEFGRYTRKRQVLLVLQEGILIARRETIAYEIILFQWRSLYVELFYDSNNWRLKHVCAFTNTNDLDVYLEEIDISSIIS